MNTGVQVKLWHPLRTRAIPECLRGVFMTRRYTNRRLPYLPSFIHSFIVVLLSVSHWGNACVGPQSLEELVCHPCVKLRHFARLDHLVKMSVNYISTVYKLFNSCPFVLHYHTTLQLASLVLLLHDFVAATAITAWLFMMHGVEFHLWWAGWSLSSRNSIKCQTMGLTKLLFYLVLRMARARCVCLSHLYLFLIVHVFVRKLINSTGCLICGSEQGWMDIQSAIRIPLDSGLGTVLKFLKFYKLSWNVLK